MLLFGLIGGGWSINFSQRTRGLAAISWIEAVAGLVSVVERLRARAFGQSASARR
jgi:hypothetical protein